MKRVAFCVLFGMATMVGMIGCADKSSSTTTQETTTPEGSTTVTKETTVEKTGDHKEGDAAAPATTPAPANP